MIEHLPVELRDRFYEIREMDLEVQSKLIFKLFTDQYQKDVEMKLDFQFYLKSPEKKLICLTIYIWRQNIVSMLMYHVLLKLTSVKKGYVHTYAKSKKTVRKILKGKKMLILINQS